MQFKFSAVSKQTFSAGNSAFTSFSSVMLNMANILPVFYGFYMTVVSVQNLYNRLLNNNKL